MVNILEILDFLKVLTLGKILSFIITFLQPVKTGWMEAIKLLYARNFIGVF